MTEESTEEASLADRCRALETELSRLQADNSALRAAAAQRVAMQKSIAGAGATIVGWIIWGPGLTASLRRWFDVAVRKREVPIAESADVAAAVVGRLFTAIILGGVLAAAPAAIIVWQNTIMQQQLETSVNARRAELLSILYDRERCPEMEVRQDGPEGGAGGEMFADDSCPHKSGWRAREEALRAYLSIERERGATPMLHRLDMRQMLVENVDFSGVMLDRANFRNAVIANVAMDHASLFRADFGHAHVSDTTFRGSMMQLAKLEGAYLERVDMEGAVLNHVDMESVFGIDVRLQDTKLYSATLPANMRFEVGGADLRCAFVGSSTVSPHRLQFSKPARCPNGEWSLACGSMLAPWCIQSGMGIPQRASDLDKFWNDGVNRYFKRPLGWPDTGWTPDAGMDRLLVRSSTADGDRDALFRR